MKQLLFTYDPPTPQAGQILQAGQMGRDAAFGLRTGNRRTEKAAKKGAVGAGFGVEMRRVARSGRAQSEAGSR